MHADISAHCSRKLANMAQRDNQAPHPTATGMTVIIPSINRSGSIFPFVTKVLSQCLPILKMMIILLRHAIPFREQDGGVHWDTFTTLQWIFVNRFPGGPSTTGKVLDEWNGQYSV